MQGERREGDKMMDEEEKINTFYALVRNIRDAHNQMSTGSKEKGKEKEGAEKEMKPAWTPSFTWEDFAEEDHEQFRGDLVMLPPTSSKNIEDQRQPKTDQKRQDQDLDLNLSL
ncbi:unnamed protein product [Dovyalis caffra]|uniref:Uncharacterized protein n=1 Tax=Dovyalis caffra TaxID=77055 RepID=A0AAV1SDY6_9ROSI|nr:unnamed protein product [Dovyalis caffra]